MKIVFGLLVCIRINILLLKVRSKLDLMLRKHTVAQGSQYMAYSMVMEKLVYGLEQHSIARRKELHECFKILTN